MVILGIDKICRDGPGKRIDSDVTAAEKMGSECVLVRSKGRDIRLLFGVKK